MVWRIALCVVAGYLLGGVNGAIVVSHALMKDDVRSKGSGNAGLTNYLRNYGGRATFLVAAIDVAKTVVACLIGLWLLPADPALGYAAAFLIFFRDRMPIALLGVWVALLALFMHRTNIVRLLHGQESKTYLRKSQRK